ncbi:hypothetical protein [Candidatus Rhabdochlamydia sp. T3358]|uniref:hypothetical protein n=1 Tax=Candidatus Rhabdochlamydia sp. T3358 TaxID=2099795 RepID=UPI0010B68DCE|nr:hypothetical protein [Candidatus Rhabdochlamydia sp. T3358]VHO03666.1 hypothetical protein RHT_01018 [Candidatus Rhabdochlamydia sp. T3358]
MVIDLNSFYLPEDKEKEEAGVFIMITCAPPSEDGKMQVEMTYEGDPFVLLYILKKAQEQFEQNDDMS